MKSWLKTTSFTFAEEKMKAHMTQILRKKDIKVKDDECSVILRLAIKCEGDDQRQAELRKNTQNMFVKRRLMSPRLLELKITYSGQRAGNVQNQTF